jgi:hypothetical protein
MFAQTAATATTYWTHTSNKTKGLLGLAFILLMAQQRCRGDWT